MLWFTGLSGSGKSTIANLVEAKLLQRRAHTILLDGDNVRHGLNKDLGFTEADRVENIRRIGEVSKLMLDAGLIVLCSFISPFARRAAAWRANSSTTANSSRFSSIRRSRLCIARDPKGLYKKALAGEIKNFTGVDQDYERPQAPEITIAANCPGPEQAADQIIAHLDARGFFALG